MTDFERVAVAWNLWTRRSAALARGVPLGPLLIGVTVTGLMIGGAAVKSMFG